MEGSTAANAPMPMIQQWDESKVVTSLPGPPLGISPWASEHRNAEAVLWGNFWSVAKLGEESISDLDHFSTASIDRYPGAPRPQDSMAVTEWSMLWLMEPACSDKECSREISKQIRRCAQNILGHEDRLEIWSKMSGIGQLEADTAIIIIQGNRHPHYTRKRDGFEPLRFTEYLHVVGHEQKAPPLSPMSLPFHIWQTQHMRGHDSGILLFHAAIARWQGSFHIIRFWFYHLKSCSIRKLGPKVAPMAPGDDGLWRPRCQSFPASPPLSRPASAPCLRAEKVVSPTRSTRSTRSLLRKGGFSGLAEATSKPLSDAKTLHPSKLAKTLRMRFCA